MTYLDNDTYQNLRALLIPATGSLIAQAELESEATEKLGALGIWPDSCREYRQIMISKNKTCIL